MFATRWTRSALLAMVLLFCGLTLGQAEQLVVDFSPDTVAIEFGITDPASSWMNRDGTQINIDRFTLTSDTTITGSSIYSASGWGAEGDGVHFAVYPDDSGSPSVDPISVELTTIDTIDTLHTDTQPALNRKHARLAIPVSLPAGTYWFSMSGVDVDVNQGTANRFQPNIGGAYGYDDNTLWYARAPGDNSLWGHVAYGDMYFTIEGAPSNLLPIAEAGPDQSIIVLNTVVQLDGRDSYDPDGDTVQYAWTLTTKPTGSNAVLSDASSATPTFVADVHGSYEIELVVSDAGGASAPDIVVVSFDNVAPQADAGSNQAVFVGDTVQLDGSASSDANLDPFTYAWTLLKPAASQAILNNSDSPYPTFVADVAGDYTASLVVSDGIVNSETAVVSVLASSILDEITDTLEAVIGAINGMDASSFKSKNMRNPLTKKLNVVLAMIDQGAFEDAIDKLENDILSKTDGCVVSGSPDHNDWIRDCDNQNTIYPLLSYVIDMLRSL